MVRCTYSLRRFVWPRLGAGQAAACCVCSAAIAVMFCSVFVCLFVPRCTDLQVGHHGLTQNESGLARRVSGPATRNGLTQNESGLARRVCGCRSGLTQNESELARRVLGPAAA